MSQPTWIVDEVRINFQPNPYVVLLSRELDPSEACDCDLLGARSVIVCRNDIGHLMECVGSIPSYVGICVNKSESGHPFSVFHQTLSISVPMDESSGLDAKHVFGPLWLSWGSGQLEKEISNNMWHRIEMNADEVAELLLIESGEMWEHMLKKAELRRGVPLSDMAFC